MSTNTTQNKKTIQKTNRILLPRGYTLYVSCEIVRDVREHLIRVEQRLAPKKGEMIPLIGLLKKVRKAKPEQFATSARTILDIAFAAWETSK